MPGANAEKSRAQGRPRKEVSANVRQQIMDAAVDLFARQGYAATPVREIADQVGVNSAMVHYYFGSKEALLHAALEQSLEPLAASVAVMKHSKEAPLQDIVTMILTAFRRKPSLPVLMTREALLPGGAMQQHFMETFAPRLGGALPQLLREEQRRGRMRSELDPRLAAQMLLGLCAFPFISQGMAEPVLGISYDEGGIDDFERHITALLERGFIP
jgi:AcrR family transcriptional regulator